MNISNLLRALPSELVTNLIEEFKKIHQNYFLGKWDSSQLNGGRFGEAVLRILEFKNTSNFTPIGTEVPRRTIVTQIVHNTSLSDSLRLYIPSLTELIMDFRNNRNVAHLGTIDVNGMDSSLVINAANWILAEIVRIEGGTSPEEAQKIISKIIERKTPIVEEIGGRLKILDPNLTSKEQILVLSYQKYPERMSENDLFSWVSEKNRTRFRQTLIQLDSDKLIDYHNQEVMLTKRGLIWVEKNINFELEF